MRCIDCKNKNCPHYIKNGLDCFVEKTLSIQANLSKKDIATLNKTFLICSEHEFDLYEFSKIKQHVQFLLNSYNNNDIRINGRRYMINE